MIEREDIDGVTVLRLSAGKVNALDLELNTAIAEELGAVEDTRPVVLTGAGSSFCAGVDLRRIVEGGPDEAYEFLTSLSRAFLAVFDHPGPTIAAVNGHAIAGGLVLALACDHRLAAEGDGRLGLTELTVGVPFPTSAIEIVRHAVGGAVAHDLVLSARLVGVDSALELGLVDRIVPPDELDRQAVALARRVGTYAPAAYGLAKRQLQRPARIAISTNTPTDDLEVNELWADDATTARIRDFLASL
ncbi:MAG: enoyl-CoA hydratase/isomerase family protein [Actinobacteria bacterium]|nr:enoyl-CoA hydratase/isomerase family protein [Actinomycetota bacterium]